MASNTHLVTAKGESDHIRPVDIRRYNLNTQGAGVMILNGCEISLYDANTVIIDPGELLIEGAFLRVQEQVSLTIQSGAPNGNRNDLIAFHYKLQAAPEGEKQASGISDAPLEVIPGTPVAGEPSDPSYIKGSIDEGALEVQIPLARLKIRGLEIDPPEELITRYNPFDPGRIIHSEKQFNPAQAFGGKWVELESHLLLGTYVYKRID